MHHSRCVVHIQGNETCLLEQGEIEMLTLFSYPGLFGVAENNPYGIKIFAFLKLCHLAFEHRHVFDASQAPRAQLPYLLYFDNVTGDRDAIISYLIRRYDLS